MNKEKGTFHFKEAVGLLLLILTVIFLSLFLLKTEPHIALLNCLLVILLIGLLRGFGWKNLEEGLIKGIQSGIQPIVILGLIGMLIGAWMSSGTIPTIMTYALTIINPDYLLITSLFSCMVISSLVGSSFTTVSTIGVALIGAGIAIGLPIEWVAGAIISGACFGDKMSPMSDTTNFASGVAKVDLFTHIRHMSLTTIPSILITTVIFFILGRMAPIDVTSLSEMKIMVLAIESQVQVSSLTLLSPIIVIILAIKRIPVIPSLIIGIVTAAITAVSIQGISFSQFLHVLQNGTSFSIENEQISNMLNRGGLQSMMWSISLILIAFAFGGLLDSLKIIPTLLNGLIDRIHSKGQLILSTASSSLGVNLLTGEQYLSILIPGQSFKSLYEDMELDRKYLSRTLEDAGTLINPLIPWGVSGAFFAQTLGVPVLAFLPFAFFLYLSPAFTILYGFLKDRRTVS
ncbi:Na+/H+ antiporter NhaC [Metabacillus halosaccharovorans]|uniref:Na+/H+ antiporter NhaC n=1 Tax=Metabacillus halosaccharovorans TaxID=930124 RepID=A0ABT3DKN9_9BACI|nr:Na+/H+ antiporter NhaC [Metabacillus halosaccharovorans]MCV9887217.1 Na+/H+ antiporter NhaC [Metabacillus halosaccharovorans]